MKKTNKDIISLFGNIQKVILTKPDINQMFDELQMMKFKIRPIQGELMSFDLKNKQFIESLWSLGKLDEFFYREISSLSKKEKELFIKLFDSLYFKYQQQLNQSNLQKKKITLNRTGLLELEIYKERKLKQKVN
ncbi:hypothetical protein CO005_00065 [Candidatus Roizmanbacteria bacterium CG_4_8_14_3_um_filter_34_9]|uniref:Uncharacterized protein n=3 Tax=Candidatus Roizmaniibacteriota TaxID=1752723 RepID=A0A2M7AUS1_9BACT|nr:MAG: hypothetical protein COT02_02905 [Candidatus Roizmanbacteria bacterium CG07_land_8_20_14_0_80_34_15]PIU74385.1 MAG: hypothetical protein COS77_01795 [Candidatus Roizmanbacteria bacterium CG06_land_8_20_14_3_00_34_14]PIW73682.1 MAG: hypothetical protein CO005_00065 [Candidatus Roizmanbacteria bacterium CG_4_8_14_3_um_filter_34_9]